MTSPVNDFEPFANDSQSLLVGPGEGLTIDNSMRRISLYGELSITKDKYDSEQLAAIDDVIAALVKIRATIVSS